MTSKQWFEELNKKLSKAIQDTRSSGDKVVLELLVEVKHLVEQLQLLLGLPRVGLDEVGDDLAFLVKKLHSDHSSLSKKELMRIVDILAELTPSQYWLWNGLWNANEVAPRSLATAIIVAWRIKKLGTKNLTKLQMAMYMLERAYDTRELYIPPPKGQ